MSVTPGLMDHAQLRVVIAEDAVLLREGLRRVLTDAGLDVAGTAGDAEQLLSVLAEQLVLVQLIWWTSFISASQAGPFHLQRS